METQEKSRQKMQKDRLHWTVSQERCESHTKQARCEQRQLSCRRWACGGRNTILLVDSALFRLEKNDGSCFWLCSLNEMGLEQPKKGYKSVGVGGKFCESSKLLLCLQRLGGGASSSLVQRNYFITVPSVPAGWCSNYCREFRAI